MSGEHDSVAAEASAPGRLGRLPTEGGLQAPIGEALVAAGVIDPPQLQNALTLQSRWRSRLGDVVLAQRGVAALRFYTVLAQHFGLHFVNLLQQPIDPALFQPERLADYAQRLVLPWREEDGQLVLAVADPGPEIFAWARATYGEQVRFVGTSKFDIVWSLQQHADAQLTHDALNLLAEHAPEHSARQVITRAQSAFLVALTVVLAAALALWPLVTLIALNTLIAVAFLATFGLKLVLAWRGARRRIDIKVSDEEVAALGDEDLPVYTVLVPMYKEPDVLPILANALRRLDYPTSKLDVKLVLEADDTETIEAAKALGLEAFFEIIRVPPSQPKTKPKACNYALRFARGQMLTIYDAEDKPEPDQLKRVVAAFRKSPADVACIQARLNYYNADENWLTRMFTLEYTLWFDFYLPALETLRIPIPLGGTSNHFRLDILRKVHAWDPYNVTEDADLGVRLTQQGYRVSVVNSTTFEEANVSIPNWIRQRSRWLKGYMQTWLVHMRNPVQLYRSTGVRGFWGFQLFVGGTFFTALAAPLMWLSYGLWLAVGSKFFDPFFPPALLYLSLLNLLLGNGFLIYMTLVAAFKRDYFRLAPYALTVPLYWLLQSIAAYKGLWQLIRNPFYWEKTTHGISKHMAEERRAALDD
ncbi:cellulose synthase/poly-beta-1,6-N-acetylglucosamine synthase-like glycosyltransferase [Xanthomonas sacchari]|uniref:glycosyltransferase family 2 protein n=1 Tax=Xanthomonas indica TaxID=2912242 RepID=UPI00136A7C59|nr:cellulose synthase/poly-beta-1,6-N-acetylglucosamine synthase-like glycosyltransferase [Xanthomonas sp. F10]MXV34680.1 glycosyltransferase [Xanthomonas sp. LMG 8989]